jgi:hypothetical protein
MPGKINQELELYKILATTLIHISANYLAMVTYGTREPNKEQIAYADNFFRKEVLPELTKDVVKPLLLQYSLTGESVLPINVNMEDVVNAIKGL